MPNLLAAGSAWLLSKQFESCAEQITLTVDGTETTPKAIISPPDRQRDNSADGADVIHSDCDFVVRVEELPAPEPTRSWTLAHLGRSFQVVDWTDSDAWGEAILLRCVRI